MRAALAVAAALLCTPLAVQAQDQTQEARTQEFAQLPYWPGYWISKHQFGTTIGGFAPSIQEAREKGEPLSDDYMPLLGLKAPWSETGKDRFAATAAARGGRKARGWGYPVMMNAAAPLQILITPEEVMIINPYSDVRHIYTDGRPMPSEDDMWPTVWGTSVGHWEGNVLVIETRGVRNPADYFHGSPPLSEEAVYYERLWLEGDELKSTMRIEDPVTLSQPWEVELAWLRDEGFDRMIMIDYDNDRTGFDGEVNTIEPATVDGE